ncbi:hypothetical protein ACFZCG_31725 [Streptomyces tanashiensis]|uniref:hypothetical protein n=1 Tax=Streptomyces tanashiensis TaxID=67367 RepID=UPI0036E9F8F7
MVQQREELTCWQDFMVVGVDKTVETVENATEEGPGRGHGLARDIDPIWLTDLCSHLSKLVRFIVRQDPA